MYGLQLREFNIFSDVFRLNDVQDFFRSAILRGNAYFSRYLTLNLSLFFRGIFPILLPRKYNGKFKVKYLKN